MLPLLTAALLSLQALFTGSRLAKPRSPATDVELGLTPCQEDRQPTAEQQQQQTDNDVDMVRRVREARQQEVKHINAMTGKATDCLGPIRGHCEACDRRLRLVLWWMLKEDTLDCPQRTESGLIALHAEADKETRLWELREDAKVWTKKEWKKYGFWQDADDQQQQQDDYLWKLTPAGVDYHRSKFPKDYERREELRRREEAKAAKLAAEDAKREAFWAELWGENGEEQGDEEGMEAAEKRRQEEEGYFDEDEEEGESDSQEEEETTLTEDSWEDRDCSSLSYDSYDDDSISSELELQAENDGPIVMTDRLKKLLAQTTRCVPTRSGGYIGKKARAERREKRDAQRKQWERERKRLYY